MVLVMSARLTLRGLVLVGVGLLTLKLMTWADLLLPVPITPTRLTLRGLVLVGVGLLTLKLMTWADLLLPVPITPTRLTLLQLVLGMGLPVLVPVARVVKGLAADDCSHCRSG